MEMNRPISSYLTDSPRTASWVMSSLLGLATFGAILHSSDAKAECAAVIGDIDGSGSANVVDVQCAILTTLWELNGGIGALPACVQGGVGAADVNCDTTINVSDVQITIQISLGQPLSIELDANQNSCPDACEVITEPCGDGICDFDLGETCITCTADCGTCDGDCCASHEQPGCTNLACQDCVCLADAFCCDVGWDDLCVGTAQTDCIADCGCEAPAPMCIDIVNCVLGCDTQACVDACFGSDLPLENALADDFLGCLVDNGCFDALTIEEFDACNLAFCPDEFGACLNNVSPQDCCVGGLLPDCIDSTCSDCVCALDSFCCTVGWDALCVGESQLECGTECGCVGGVDQCLVVTNCTLGCADQACVDACFASGDAEGQYLSNILLLCLVDNGCLATTTQAEFDACIAGFCSAEATVCVDDGAVVEQDCCAVGTGPGCSDPTCESCVCTLDPFCCDTTWDDVCVGEANLECATECACGGTSDATNCVDTFNCVVACPDGACVDQCYANAAPGADALTDALLGCLLDNLCFDSLTPEDFDACLAANCSVESDACVATPPQDCCIGGPAPGCSNTPCQDCVCALDPFCCDTSWDSICIEQATLDCADTCACATGSDCCTPSANPGCAIANCETCVCAGDAFCCETSWDELCVEAAQTTCFAECGCAPPEVTCTDVVNCALSCPLGDTACINACIALASGQPLADATALYACISANGCDTATTLDEFNLCISTNCPAETAACIGEPAQNDCCVDHATPGCADAVCATCVCTLDAFCCDTAWDGLCVDTAGTACAADCGCIPQEATCVETVNCGLACPSGDTVCVDTCLAQTSGQTLTDSITLLNCLVTAGCDAAITQEEFDVCLAANCLTEAETCIGEPAQSDCCLVQTTAGCTDTVCETCVCTLDAFCCDTTWDDLCVGAAETTCVTECGCVAQELTCVETVNCGLSCPPGDTACINACLAQTSGQALTDSTALLNCLIAAGCDTTTTQAEFDACLAANCVPESDICLGGPVEPGDCCVAGTAPGCVNAACETCVCALDTFCCDTAWDGLCVDQATADCPTECGCTAVGGDCCVPATTPGCAETACETCVCTVDAFCCDTSWDDVCVGEAATDCPTECGCDPPAADCCLPSADPGCADAACETCVCTLDAFCCETSWDEICVGEAGNECQASCGCDPGSTGTGTNCVEVFNCFFDCATQVCADACIDAGGDTSVALFADLYFCLDDANCFAATTAAQFNQCLGFFCSPEADLCIADP